MEWIIQVRYNIVDVSQWIGGMYGNFFLAVNTSEGKGVRVWAAKSI